MAFYQMVGWTGGGDDDFGGDDGGGDDGDATGDHLPDAGLPDDGLLLQGHHRPLGLH